MFACVCVYKSINVCTGESTKLLGDNVNTILAGCLRVWPHGTQLPTSAGLASGYSSRNCWQQVHNCYSDHRWRLLKWFATGFYSKLLISSYIGCWGCGGLSHIIHWLDPPVENPWRWTGIIWYSLESKHVLFGWWGWNSGSPHHSETRDWICRVK